MQNIVTQEIENTKSLSLKGQQVESRRYQSRTDRALGPSLCLQDWIVEETHEEDRAATVDTGQQEISLGGHQRRNCLNSLALGPLSQQNQTLTKGCSGTGPSLYQHGKRSSTRNGKAALCRHGSTGEKILAGLEGHNCLPDCRGAPGYIPERRTMQHEQRALARYGALRPPRLARLFPERQAGTNAPPLPAREKV